MTNHLTQARLKELLHYDPETGVFTRLVSRGGSKKGAQAGTIQPEKTRAGRRRRLPARSIGIDGKDYRAGRLAFLYMVGAMPVNEADHINLDSLDDRWENLRDATRYEQEANKAVYRNNRSGLKGAHFEHGRWRSSIQRGWKRVRLGYFDTPEEAHAAYLAAAGPP